MAITYSAGDGSRITSFLVTQALGNQSQQTNNNTIVLDNIPSLATGYGGNVGDGTLGTGDSYLNRRIVIDVAGTPQERIVTADVAGTAPTRILTVHEDWDTNPVATTDTVDVYYEIADVEDGGASGGISFATRTGLWTLSNDFAVGNGTDKAGLAIHGGQAIEVSDEGITEAFNFLNNGYFRTGYYANGEAISGGVIAITAASDDEPAGRFDSGCDVAFLDTLIWAQVATLSQISNTGGNVVYDKVKLLKTTQECEVYGDTLINSSIAGESKITEIVRADANTSCNNLILEAVQVLDSTANTTIETIEMTGVVFSGVPGYVDVRQNKTWNLIDPSWDVTTFTQLTWTGTATGNELNDKRSVVVTVQQADGTKLQDAVVIVYEGTQLDDLVITEITDVNGLAASSFIYLKHATNSITTIYGNHAVRVFNHGYTPFIATQLSTSKLSGAITLITDTAISETIKATAITNGTGVNPIRHATGETDPRPLKVMGFDAGTGSAPSVGETISSAGSPIATGVVVEYIGTAVSGTIVLENWNGVEFIDNEGITGGVSTFSALTDTAAFYEEYTWEIDCSTKSLQIVYDYMAAQMSNMLGSPPSVLGAVYEQLHEWGSDQEAQAIYSGGSGYYTNNAIQTHVGGSPLPSEGVWLSNAGAGTIAYLTSDGGTQFSTVLAPITVQGVTEGAAVKIVANETVGTVTTGDVILEQLADSNGEASTNITYQGAFDPSGLDIITRVRSSGLPTAAIQDDNGVFTDETTAANSAVTADMNLLPVTPVVNQDNYIFGHAEKFGKLKLDINTAGTGGFTITWQYWNGAWTNLTGVTDDTNSFSTISVNYVEWTIPGDWVTTTINSQGPYYYIRAAYTAGTVTISPTGTRCSLDVNRYLPFVQDGTVLSTGLTVTASWLRDTIAKFKP